MIPRVPNSTASHLKSTPRGLKFDYQSPSPPSTDQKSISRGPKLSLRGPKSTPMRFKNRLQDAHNQFSEAKN